MAMSTTDFWHSTPASESRRSNVGSGISNVRWLLEVSPVVFKATCVVRPTHIFGTPACSPCQHITYVAHLSQPYVKLNSAYWSSRAINSSPFGAVDFVVCFASFVYVRRSLLKLGPNPFELGEGLSARVAAAPINVSQSRSQMHEEGVVGCERYARFIFDSSPSIELTLSPW
jgi:hypothetical protein